MTEAVLVSVIACLCGHMKPEVTMRLCMETYVNCAVTYDKGILSKEDFNKKCNFIKGQEECIHD